MFLLDQLKLFLDENRVKIVISTSRSDKIPPPDGQKDLCVIFLDARHYTVACTKRATEEIGYFDPLGATRGNSNRMRIDVSMIREAILGISETYPYKLKYNDNRTQPEDSAVCGQHVLAFAWSYSSAGLDEEYAQASEFVYEDPV